MMLLPFSPNPNCYRHQRGFSIVEVAVAMVIIGVGAALSWQVVRSNWTRADQENASNQIQRAEAALMTFLAINNHLPCPASSTDGWEDCQTPSDARDPDRMFFPFRTVGVPKLDLENLRYRPLLDLTHLPDRDLANRKFQVLVNDGPISVESAPRARPTLLGDVASATYDGILDVCEALSRAGQAGTFAFSLEQRANANVLIRSLGVTSRKVSAGQVSDYLSCIPLIAVGGRSQFNAHLASAILSKTLREYKWISEAEYGTYTRDLAEGAFTMSAKVVGEVRRWPKTVQALSSYFASRSLDLNTVRMMTGAVVNQTATMMSTITQASNLARFAVNLEAYRARYKVILDLTMRADSLYAPAWEHAVLSGSSAFFLKEQSVLPPKPVPLGPLGANSVNFMAESSIELARNRSAEFGADEVRAALIGFPKFADVESGISIDLAVDTDTLTLGP